MNYPMNKPPDVEDLTAQDIKDKAEELHQDKLARKEQSKRREARN